MISLVIILIFLIVGGIFAFKCFDIIGDVGADFNFETCFRSITDLQRKGATYGWSAETEYMSQKATEATQKAIDAKAVTEMNGWYRFGEWINPFPPNRVSFGSIFDGGDGQLQKANANMNAAYDKFNVVASNDKTFQQNLKSANVDMDSWASILNDYLWIVIAAIVIVVILIIIALHLSKKSKRKHELELARINSNSQQTPVLPTPQPRLIESATLSKVNFNANAVLNKYAADLGYDSDKVLSDFDGDTERAALALQREAGRKASGMSSTYLDELKADE